MKTILKSKFEGGIINHGGHTGASYIVRITVKDFFDPKSKISKQIEEIVDRFDHTLTVGGDDEALAIKSSSRVVVINHPIMEEYLYCQILFNLFFEIIKDQLISVEVFNSEKFSYVSEEKRKDLSVCFNNLKGK